MRELLDELPPCFLDSHVVRHGDLDVLGELAPLHVLQVRHHLRHLHSRPSQLLTRVLQALLDPTTGNRLVLLLIFIYEYVFLGGRGRISAEMQVKWNTFRNPLS